MMILICIDFSEELCVYYHLALNLASFRHLHPDQYSEKDKPVSQRNDNYCGMITSPDLIQSTAGGKKRRGCLEIYGLTT